jgi:hypothetical protein
VYYTNVEDDVIPDSRVLRLMKRDLGTGHESELFRRRSGYFSFYGLLVSPDGSRVVFLDSVGTNPRTLVVMPSNGGTPSELHPSHPGHPRPSDNVKTWIRDWTPDSRYVVTRMRDNTTWAFPADGSEPRQLKWPLPEVGDISPDGRHTAYTVRSTTRELRTIDNLLSALTR